MFWRMLQCYFALKLEKCFLDFKNSPDFYSTWGKEMIIVVTEHLGELIL